MVDVDELSIYEGLILGPKLAPRRQLESHQIAHRQRVLDILVSFHAVRSKVLMR
jgi:hypothetical protein